MAAASGFWGITLNPEKSKKAEIPEGSELVLTNVAIQSGEHSAFFAEVDDQPKVCIAVLDAKTCPQHCFSLTVLRGSTVKLSNKGNAILSVIGVQHFFDDEDEEDFDDEEIPSDFEDEEDDEDEDEEEEEEDAKKGVKRPEPKVEKKVEKPVKQQKPEPNAEKKVEKKPEKKVEKKPEKKVEKKPEKKVEKKPEKKVEKKPEKKPESSGAARCEICKRNFNSEKALEQHNAAKHGKK